MTAGQIGYVVVVTGRGDSVETARVDAYGRVDKLVVPNGRYRNDIGGRLMASGLRELSRLGWWE